MNSIMDTAVLNNGVRMPWLGLGVFQMDDADEVENAICWAMEAGYRSIDTATAYNNEEGVGRGVRSSGVPREEIFITTKLWNDSQGYDSTLKAFDASLKALDTDYVDLYLIHWPVKGKYKDTWRAMEEIYESGRARAVGVSNFLIHHLKDILADSKVVPAVNQIEFHPYLQQPHLQDLCRENGIHITAWSPIMQGEVLQVPELIELGKKYGKNPVHITLRWMLQKGISAIPKSARRERILDNADIFDFTLQPEEMTLIDSLDRGERIKWSGPGQFEFLSSIGWLDGDGS